MNWKGTTLETAGQVMSSLDACATPEEAREFADQYTALYPDTGRNNLEFGISYFIGGKRAAELYRWLRIETSEDEQMRQFAHDLVTGGKA